MEAEFAMAELKLRNALREAADALVALDVLGYVADVEWSSMKSDFKVQLSSQFQRSFTVGK